MFFYSKENSKVDIYIYLIGKFSYFEKKNSISFNISLVKVSPKLLLFMRLDMQIKNGVKVKRHFYKY